MHITPRGIIIWKLMLYVLLWAVPMAAQAAPPWSGILDPSRATDWSQAGVQGGIPNRTTVCATLNSGSSAAQINTAIASCPSGQVVQLGAGTFNLSSTINIYRSDITLRGQGMSTILNFTNSGGTNWQGGGDTLIAVQASGFDLSGYNSAPGITGVPASTVRDWTGTNGQTGVYTQGSTVLNLASAPTGLAVGGTLTLWQSDPPDNSVPNSGYFVSAKANGTNNVALQGSGQTQRAGQVQRANVVAINGSQVTISPGIYRPTGTWETARSPKAGWQPGTIRGVGLENFRMTRTLTTTRMIGLLAAADSWVSGIGFVGGTNYGGDNILGIIDSRNLTIRNNWIDPAGGANTGQSTFAVYGISLIQASGCLVENNILNGLYAPIVMNSASTGNVIAYNFENYVSGEGGLQWHEEGAAMNLIEGNKIYKTQADFFHGNTALNTIFRNNIIGNGIDLWPYHRWYNLIGNVMNASVYKSIYSDATKYDRWSGVAFRLGYAASQASGTNEPGSFVFPDPMVATSTMLWGNYVTAGASTRWLASEVPSSDPVFPNPVPASQSLPASFYLTARPSWWPAAKPWPPIGPDVTGGSVSGYAGHVHTIPAQDCFSSSGSLANFNPATCYDTGEPDTQTPASPKNLRLQ